MRRRDEDEGGVVWSSDQGRTCPGCGEPVDRCRCRRGRPPAPVPGDGTVRVGRESKGRRGKTVTVVTGLPLTAEELDDLARDLKKRCGTGGTVRDGTVEIQGDQRDVVARELARRGFDVKRAGG